MKPRGGGPPIFKVVARSSYGIYIRCIYNIEIPKIGGSRERRGQIISGSATPTVTKNGQPSNATLRDRLPYEIVGSATTIGIDILLIEQPDIITDPIQIIANRKYTAYIFIACQGIVGVVRSWILISSPEHDHQEVECLESYGLARDDSVVGVASQLER